MSFRMSRVCAVVVSTVAVAAGMVVGSSAGAVAGQVSGEVSSVSAVAVAGGVDQVGKRGRTKGHKPARLCRLKENGKPFHPRSRACRRGGITVDVEAMERRIERAVRRALREARREAREQAEAETEDWDPMDHQVPWTP
jgi:hypothetical protein